ncbi:MAG: hydrolase TatD [Betaproteobacteria bacterium]|nr:MAG: hydrolase TatD [Betaproteobacteria bacterium]TMH46716.1 MAG: hydrolase TatD [Betaproteobacteria bacterium]
MQLVDIGANLTHASFRDDLDAVVARARAAGVGTIIVTGSTVLESRLAAELADRYELYCTAGVHPHHARDCDERTIAELRKLALHPRCVAIGECGLDFNRNYSPHPDQEKWFVAQLELGLELGKPLFLHSRDAHPRFANILRTHGVKTAVAHCFTGEAEELRAYLELGLYIGVTGWICDERRGAHLLPLVRDIPADRLLLETDSPYLTPRDMKPQPKARRNEPAFLPHILQTVARALGRPAEEVAVQTTRNAQRLFGIDESRALSTASRAATA